MLAQRSCASLTSLRLPSSASASSIRSAEPERLASVNTRSSAFSVSPRYFEMTRDKSILRT